MTPDATPPRCARQVAGRDGVDRRPDEAHAQAAQDETRCEVPPSRVGLRRDVDPRAAGREREEARDEQIFAVDLLRELRGDAGRNEHGQRLDRNGEARVNCAEPEHRLHVDGQRQVEAEDGESHRRHHQGHQREIAIFENCEWK
jgi:hypothetical protein